MSEQKTKDDGYVSVATKVPVHVAELLKILARMRGMEVYELLQLLLNGFISYAKSDMVAVPDEFRHLYESLKMDAAWNKAYNFASPTAQQDIAQMVLVLQQPGRTGFGVVKIDKPFMDDATMTLSMSDIIERMLELALGKKDYLRLRKINTDLQTFDPIETIRTMLDEQDILDIEHSNAMELPGSGNFHDFGRLVEYGNKHKRVPHRTPDSVAQQQTIHFDNYDKHIADMEVQECEGEHKMNNEEPPEGFEPFDQEW